MDLKEEIQYEATSMYIPEVYSRYDRFMYLNGFEQFLKPSFYRPMPIRMPRTPFIMYLYLAVECVASIMNQVSVNARLVTNGVQAVIDSESIASIPAQGIKSVTQLYIRTGFNAVSSAVGGFKSLHNQIREKSESAADVVMNTYCILNNLTIQIPESIFESIESIASNPKSCIEQVKEKSLSIKESFFESNETMYEHAVNSANDFECSKVDNINKNGEVEGEGEVEKEREAPKNVVGKVVDGVKNANKYAWKRIGNAKRRLFSFF